MGQTYNNPNLGTRGNVTGTSPTIPSEGGIIDVGSEGNIPAGRDTNIPVNPSTDPATGEVRPNNEDKEGRIWEGVRFDQNGKPIRPVRSWFNYLPIGDQMYEDAMAAYLEAYDQWMLDQSRTYESPENWMELLSKGGLNPNLAYQTLSQKDAGTAEGKRPDNLMNYQRAQKNIKDNTMMALNIATQGSAALLNRTQAITEAKKQGLMSAQRAGQEIQNAFNKTHNDQLIESQKLENIGKTYNNKLIKEYGFQRAQQELKKVSYEATYAEFKANWARKGVDVSKDPWWLKAAYIATVKSEVNSDESIDLRRNIEEKYGTTSPGITIPKFNKQ